MFCLKFFLLPLFFLFINSCSTNFTFSNSPRAENGVLNLTFWDFEKNGIISLEGNWEIYWKQLYQPNQLDLLKSESSSGYFTFPGFWNDRMFQNEVAGGDGFATFKLKILLPDKQTKRQKLAIRMKEQATAYELYMDNELLSQKGKVGKDKTSSVPGYGTNTVFFETEKPVINLILVVSNFHHRNGGVWSIPKLGNHEQIQNQKYERNFLEFLLGGSILIMTIYHFILFLFRRTDLTSLYFAFFCLIALMRVVSTGEVMIVQLIPSIPYELVTKFEYFSFYLLAPLFLIFFTELFPNDIPISISQIGISIGGILGMIVCFFNLKVYNNFVDFNYIVLFITILIVIFHQIKIILRRRDDSILIFLSTNILVLFIVNDFLYNKKLVQTSELLQVGVFIFLLAQSVILSRRFSLAFSDIERISNHLSIVNKAYSNFVPKEFLALLGKESITDIQLGNLVNTEITILFSGIRGFTSICDKMNPVEIFDLLNEYYTGITSIIRRNKGFIDKFIGDEIVVLFPESPEHAIITAREMAHYLEDFNLSQVKKQKLNIKIGIGIHTGQVTLGTLGGKERMDTTVIGNVVGVAKKLESLTKSFFTTVIISEQTYSGLEIETKAESREIDHIKLKGVDGFMTIYEYFGGDFDIIREKKKNISAEYFHALTLYRGGLTKKAKEIFSNCLTLIPDDPISSLYINRCNDFLLGSSTVDTEQNLLKPILALIADNNKLSLDEMEVILKKEKLDVITVGSGEETLTTCKSMNPSLIFISLNLGDKNPYELIKTLRKDLMFSKSDCYIVVMADEITQKIKSQIYECGANDFILKPIRIESIKNIIERVNL